MMPPNPPTLKTWQAWPSSAVTIDGDVSSARLTVNNGETAYTFTGTGALVDGANPMSLVKRGEGGDDH